MAGQLRLTRDVWAVLVKTADGTVYVESVHTDPVEADDREAELKSEFLDRTDLRDVWSTKTKLSHRGQLLDMKARRSSPPGGDDPVAQE